MSRAEGHSGERPAAAGVQATAAALTRTLGFRFLNTPSIVLGATQRVGGQAIGTGQSNHVLTAAFDVDDAGALVMADCYTSGRPPAGTTAEFLTTCASVVGHDAAIDWVRAGLAAQAFGSRTFASATLWLEQPSRDTARLVIHGR